jgi:hypothetical protein
MKKVHLAGFWDRDFLDCARPIRCGNLPAYVIPMSTFDVKINFGDFHRTQ